MKKRKMMKTCTCFASGVFLLALSHPASARDDLPPAPIPSIPAVAKTPKGFVSKGWKLEQSATGDLNGDKIADVAIVMHSNDPQLVVKKREQDLGRDTFDSNPRSVVIALGQKDGGFRFLEASHSLIPRVENGVIDDPYDTDPIAITKGVVKLSIRYWASAGSWSMSLTGFTFQYRNGGMYLIGYDKHDMHRGSAEEEIVSINFLTNRMSIGESMTSEDDIKTRWKSIDKRPLVRLKDIGNGWEFQPVPETEMNGE